MHYKMWKVINQQLCKRFRTSARFTSLFIDMCIVVYHEHIWYSKSWCGCQTGKEIESSCPSCLVKSKKNSKQTSLKSPTSAKRWCRLSVMQPLPTLLHFAVTQINPATLSIIMTRHNSKTAHTASNSLSWHQFPWLKRPPDIHHTFEHVQYPIVAEKFFYIS